MVLSPEIYGQIVAHARDEAPNECCGMIATADGRAVEVFRATNAAASPLRYEVEPADQLRIETTIEESGWELGAIYHSHTRSAPCPSQTDINLAFHPHAVYLILGLASGEPELRGYRIVDGKVEEVEVTVG
jgi:[CysO sulfur-carrier protein]-S-L-cysteine hydrolase